MGQIEVYELLKNKRLSGDESYFSVSEIEKMMRDAGYTNGCIKSVRASVLSLYDYGYLDSKMISKWRDWKRVFRLSDKKFLDEKERLNKNG